MERRFMWVRGLGLAVAMCACTGQISIPGQSPDTFGGIGGSGGSGNGGGDDHVTAPGVYDPTFKCDPTQTVLAASPIKRLAKAHWLNGLNEMLSPLAANDRTTLLASVQ